MILTVLRKETSSASLSPSAILLASTEGDSVYDHLLAFTSIRSSQLSIPIATLP